MLGLITALTLSPKDKCLYKMFDYMSNERSTYIYKARNVRSHLWVRNVREYFCFTRAHNFFYELFGNYKVVEDNTSGKLFHELRR